MKLNHDLIAEQFNPARFSKRKTKQAMDRHPMREFAGKIKSISPITGIVKHNDIDPKLVLQLVANNYRITVEEMKSKTRIKKYVASRQTCCWILKQITDFSLQEIGYVLGGLDHATVLHSCRAIDNYIFSKDNVGINAKLLLNQIS